MSLQTKIQALIDSANTTTGESDVTLTGAIHRLISGFGGSTSFTGWTFTQISSGFLAKYAIASRNETVVANGLFYSFPTGSTITLNEGITRIGTNAFRSSGFASMLLPTTLKYIDATAFRSAVWLTSITLPAGMITVAPDAFRDCAISDFYVAEGFDCNLSLGSLDGLNTVSQIVDSFKDNSTTGVTRILTIHADVYELVSAATFAAAGAKGLTIASA